MDSDNSDNSDGIPDLPIFFRFDVGMSGWGTEWSGKNWGDLL
jgi:hypothetical protein